MQYYLVTYSLRFYGKRDNMVLNARLALGSHILGALWIHSVTPIFI